MAGGRVNRTVLQSFYQSPGQIYEDTKTEGAIETVAAQVDANWDDYAAHNHDTRYYTQQQVDTKVTQAMLGNPPLGGVNKAMLAPDVLSLLDPVVNIERVQANLVAIAEINSQSIPQSGYGYDLFRGSTLNLYSCAILDTFQTNVAATIAVGATSVTLPTVAGLAAGREITLQDIVTESKRERLIIQSIVGNAVTFVTPTVNAYAAQAKVYRSLGKVDTVAKKLLFGGASYQASQSAASTVVASAYDTSGNGGRKVTVLSNGWIVAVVYDSANKKFIFEVDKVDGNGWQQLCFATKNDSFPPVGATGAAIASNGTTVYFLYASGSGTTYDTALIKFDAATITNIEVNAVGYTYSVGSQQTFIGAVTLTVGSDGSLHMSRETKNATYPNSKNIQYSKSTDGGATWAAVTQITTNNTTGQDYTNPCIVVRSNGNPVIFHQFANGTTSYQISANYWNGTAFSANVAVYFVSTYAQVNPCAAIAPNGRIWCVWHGFDATDTAKMNLRIKYSDDGGATWINAGVSAEKLTSGNTVQFGNPTINVDKNNNVYVLSSNESTWFIQKFVYTTSWQAPVDVSAAGDTAAHPSSVENNTLDFSDPLFVHKTTAAVKFRGTWVTTTTLPLTQEDIRYNITPPTGLMDELRSWMQYDDVVGFTVTSAASIVDTAANESFAAMTAATDDYGTYKETYFNGFVAAVQEKGAQRITMQRASVNDAVAVTKYLAAVIGG